MGDLVRALVELAVADRLIAEDDGDGVGVLRRLPLEQLVRAPVGNARAGTQSDHAISSFMISLLPA